MSARVMVREALQSLCAEARAKDEAAGIAGLFGHNFTAKVVANRAGVSVSTARKYLDELSRCRGYSRARFAGGTFGYKYRGEY